MLIQLTEPCQLDRYFVLVTSAERLWSEFFMTYRASITIPRRQNQLCSRLSDTNGKIYIYQIDRVRFI